MGDRAGVGGGPGFVKRTMKRYKERGEGQGAGEEHGGRRCSALMRQAALC